MLNYFKHFFKNLNSDLSYRWTGKWAGNTSLDENCTNPDALYESIVAKPEDLFQEIEYNYLDGSAKLVESATATSSKIRSYVDVADHGRCYTFKPTEQMIKSGIKRIELKPKPKNKRLTLYFHTNGIFETKMNNHNDQFFVNSTSRIDLNLDFTVYNMLDIGGQPCRTETGFDKDACTEFKLDKKSLEMFGCTSPFGPNKDKICNDYENGSKVMKLYEKAMSMNVDNCHSPCLFASTKTTKTDEQFQKKLKERKVRIFAKEYIEVKEAYHLYSFLSMIAEVGGYVGLFLGVSVNQVSKLVSVLLDKLGWICNRKKRIF